MGNPEFNINRPSREDTKTKGYYKSKCPKCGAVRKDSQLGLEETPEEYVEKMVEVFRQIKRVLKHDGTVWLNLGDSYASSIKGDNRTREEKQKKSNLNKNKNPELDKSQYIKQDTFNSQRKN